MKPIRRAVGIIVAGYCVVNTAGCQVSLRNGPAGQAVPVAQFVGTWSGSDDVTVLSSDNGEETADVSIVQNGDTFHLKGRLVTVADRTVAILSDDNWLHVNIAQVEIISDSVHVWLPNEQVIRDAVANSALSGRVQSLPDGSLSTTIVDASPEDLASFVAETEDLFGETPTYVLEQSEGLTAVTDRAGVAQRGISSIGRLAVVGLVGLVALMALMRRHATEPTDGR